MKKIFSATAIASLLIMPIFALAQAKCSDFITEDACLTNNCMWNPATDQCAGIYIATASDVIDIINRIGNWIFALLLAIAGIMLILAGFFWVTAGGDPASVLKARQMLTNALIGVVIALVAKGLVMAILSILGA